MARILTTGFETGVVRDEISAGGADIFSTIVRTGTYSIKPSPTGMGAAFFFPNGPVSEFYLGVGVYTVGSYTFFYIRDVGGVELASITILSSGIWRLSCNGQTADTPAPYNWDEWHYLEVHYKSDNSSGVFEIKVNGTLAASITGDTIVDGGVQPAYVNFNSGFNSAYLDDLVINDTSGSVNNSWPGRVKLYPLRPNAAGDVTQLDRGGVDSGANWSQVDEAPASDTDYVYSDQVDEYDLYNFDTFTLPAGHEITNIIVVNDAYLIEGTGKLAGKIKSDGVEAQGEDHILSNTAHAYSDAFPVNPATGAQWDQTDVDNIQAGPMTRAA